MELQPNLYIEFLENCLIQKQLRLYSNLQILVNFEVNCQYNDLPELLTKNIGWPKFESHKKVTGEIWSTELMKKIGLIMIEKNGSFESYNILIVVFKKFRGKDLGSRIAKSLFQKIASFPHIEEIRINIEQENDVGIKLLLSLGFTPVLNNYPCKKSLNFIHVIYTLNKGLVKHL